MRRRVIRTGDFDIAHLAFLNRFSDQAALPWLGRGRILFSTVHDVMPHNRRLPDRVERLLLTRLYHSAGLLVVHHEVIRDELVKSFGLDRDTIEVIPHWITPHRISQQRRSLSDQPTVLFQGSFRRNKGIEVLLDAIDQLRGSPIRFVIAGRGERDIELAVTAKAATNPNVVAEIGWMHPERKNELLADADLAVLPYTTFGSQSGVLHDAFGSHLPVVVTDVGAMGKTVRESRTGTVIAPNSKDQLAQAISEILTDDRAWGRAAAAAQALAAERSPARTAAAFRDMYARALSTR